MIHFVVTLDRNSRLTFDGRYTLSEKEWYDSDEFRKTGHVPWEPPQNIWSSRRVMNAISMVFQLLNTIDHIYILCDRLDKSGIQSSLNTAVAMNRMNVRFDNWTSCRGIGPDGHNDYEYAFFFFRKQEDAAMFQMLWG